MMRRIQYHEYGGPDVMRLEEFEPAALRPKQVRVRVRAAAANPMDFGIRSGAMKMVTGRAFPRAMGYDFAGVIEAVGDAVTRLRVGDEVLGGSTLKSAGAFADVVIAEEGGVVAKPSTLSFESAAAVPTVGITAWQALFTAGKLQPGNTVFVHGCLGGVGRSAVQIAMAHGASVGGSCRPSRRDEARELGVDPIVDFEFDTGALAGRFDLVLDTGGTLTVKAATKMLKPGGRIVSVYPTPANILRSSLPGPFHAIVARAVTEDLKAVAELAGRGGLRLPIARSVSLDDAIPALTDLETGRMETSGKLIIAPS